MSAGRLEGKVAIVCGAGQTPGETVGNGRATALLFAREGARVLCVDRRIDSATDTEQMARDEGAEASSLEVDVTDAGAVDAMARECLDRYGRIDVLHNNVGIGAGDGPMSRLTEDGWHRILDVNLKSMFLTCRAVVPVMREQGSGAIVNVSSVASIANAPALFAYKISKAGVNALTQQVAITNARYGVRCNAILPGLMDTPMAVDAPASARGVPRDEVARGRHASVPLRAQMGSGWDIAYAALYLASDEASFVTGVLLPVDGGQTVKVG